MATLSNIKRITINKKKSKYPKFNIKFAEKFHKCESAYDVAITCESPYFFEVIICSSLIVNIKLLILFYECIVIYFNSF